ncbi:MAG: thiamine pyrophosphate-dependent dehydrogenase E1 component subunit alpha [Elusimicrobia bacterium]|nr:thiamine pyrophosphate-dependent dehydrogenase E1 component subunit alpha [Elusimicrobiota bacterium]
MPALNTSPKSAANRSIPSEALVEMLRSMRRIRAIEERIESEYSKDEMKTPVHLYIGQEAVGVGVSANLRKDDYVFTGHRSHGHYLAKGGDLKAMMAELYCRETGCSGGRGGSMHLIDKSVGMLGSSAIVGGSVSIAVGTALASQRLGQGRVAVAYFGDAALEEGGVFESINAAVLWNLPVLFVCENNLYSVHSHLEARQTTIELAPKVKGFGLPSVKVDGSDLFDVYEKSKAAVERARAGDGPSFLECQTYRWRAHSGAGDAGAAKYRKAGEHEEWMKRCPIGDLEKKLIADGDLAPKAIAEMDAEISREIDEAFAFAKQSPFPKNEDLGKHVFFEPEAK